MRSPFRIDLMAGKTALITGGGTGICRGIAAAYGAHGAKLIIMGRRADVLAATCKEFAAAGVTADFIAGDVRKIEDCEAAVAKALQSYGQLDVLLNGAAGNFLCPTEKLSSNAFKTVIDIDLLGTFNMSKAALAGLRASQSGVILNISATLHYQGTEMQAHVMAAKAGIDALARNLACEWGPDGIRVVTIAPGPIGDTEGMRRLGQGRDAEIAQQIPLRRLGKIEDIANAALYLTSEAAAYVTGEVLVVDGGQWLVKPPFISRAIFDAMAAADCKRRG